MSGDTELPEPASLRITEELILRAQGGDDRALETLLARYIPRLTRWATGRLPHRARSVKETNDLVQEVVVRTLHRFGRIDPSIRGGFQSYLRRGIINAIRNEIDKADRRPQPTSLDNAGPDSTATPLEAAIGADTMARYEAALANLSRTDREAIVARVEFGLTYEETAEALGKPSADAARMAVGRALTRLARAMEELS